MRIKPRGRPVNSIDLFEPSTEIECDDTTTKGGQAVSFDENGIICHLNDSTDLYEYASHSESIHSSPLLDPIIHVDEYEYEYNPDNIDGLIANLGEVPELEPEINDSSTSTIPPMSTVNESGKPLSK
jgi:hypothetical protein